MGLTLIGLFRELLGAGQIFGFQILSLSWFTPITIFVMAPGAFFVLAALIAIQNQIRISHGKKPRKLQCEQGCAGCTGCGSDYSQCNKEEKEEA